MSTKIIGNIRLDVINYDDLFILEKINELEHMGWKPFYSIGTVIKCQKLLAIYSKKILIYVGFEPPIMRGEER